MKLFQTVQRDLALMGIEQNQAPFNKRHLKGCLLFGANIFFGCVDFCLKVNHIKENMNNVFMLSTGMLIYIAYAHTVFEAKKLFEFIQNVEKAVDESE